MRQNIIVPLTIRVNGLLNFSAALLNWNSTTRIYHLAYEHSVDSELPRRDALSPASWSARLARCACQVMRRQAQ